MSVPFSVAPKGLLKFMTLMSMVEKFHGLLQTYGDEKTDDNRSNVDKEALPRVNSFVGSVNLEHGHCDLRDGTCFQIRRHRCY